MNVILFCVWMMVFGSFHQVVFALCGTYYGRLKNINHRYSFNYCTGTFIHEYNEWVKFCRNSNGQLAIVNVTKPMKNTIFNLVQNPECYGK